MNEKDCRVVIKTTMKGEKIVTIDGKKIKLFEDEGVMVPILTLSTLTTQDLSDFYGIAVDYDPESADIKKYPTLGNFSELRICFYSNLIGPGVKASVVVFDPEDIEELDLHDQYQLQFEDEILQHENVEIWGPAHMHIDDMISLVNELDRVSALTGEPYDFTPIGYVGFWVDLVGTSYEHLLIQLFQFLDSIDEKVRKKIKK